MRVLFIHPCHPNQFTRTAHELGTRAGWECAMLVGDGWTEAVRRENPPIAYYGYRDEQTPSSNAYYMQSLEEGTRRGKAVVDVVAHIHAHMPLDAVVGHASFGTTFFIREVLNIPVVSYVELPGYHALKARSEFPTQGPHAYIDVSLRALIYTAALHSDRVITPSKHAKNLFPPELQAKVRVQMEGFDAPTPVLDKAALRRDLGLPENVPMVGFAARTLEGVRGFDVFVEAAKLIRAQRPDTQFLVLGEESTLYGNETAHLNGVSFKRYALTRAGMNENELMWRPYMAYETFTRHLQAMDIALFPLFEGAANWGLFEAMACGLPVVASDRCFVPEVIAHRRNGLSLPIDARVFAEETLALLANPQERRRLGRNARATVLQRYAVARAADGYADVLYEAVASSRTTPQSQRRVGGKR